MDLLDQRIAAAQARDKLSTLNDDTAIEEDLAALYLCVSPKKLGEMRASGGGPVFVKPQAPAAAGRNQPVSYVMSELRKWRLAMSANSNLEIARRQGMVGWVSAIEPFWTDAKGLLIGSAVDRFADRWAEHFLKAIRRAERVDWMTPSQAAKSRWASFVDHGAFVQEYKEVLEREIFSALAALEATEISSETREIDS
jgi:hypothetical protein